MTSRGVAGRPARGSGAPEATTVRSKRPGPPGGASPRRLAECLVGLERALAAADSESAVVEALARQIQAYLGGAGVTLFRGPPSSWTLDGEESRRTGSGDAQRALARRAFRAAGAGGRWPTIPWSG
jgi:hypothetical protein